MDTPPTALVRKRTDTELMMPPPAAKKIKRPKTALDEEAYTDGLSQIIARDFFPGLLETQTQQEYLDALASKDQRWISSAGRRLKDVMTPGRRRATDTPRREMANGGGATPSARGMNTPASVTTVTSSVATVEERKLDTSMSLTAFQGKYTSEDNESFYKLLDRQNQKRVEKHAWAWNGNKLPSKQMIAQRQVEDNMLQTRGLIDDGFKRDRLAIKDRDERPAQPDTWKSTGPKNTLMFLPEGVDDGMETRAEELQAESRMGPKEIVYENTRAPDPNRAVETPRPGSPSRSEVRQAISGNVPKAYASSTIMAGDETPRVNGYAFVDDEDDADSVPPPIIDLGAGDATPNPFRLAESRKREVLHHRMVDRIAESRKTASRNGMTGNTGSTPVPRFPSSSRVSAGGLTPAGKRLFGKLATPAAGTPMGAGMGVFDLPRASTPRASMPKTSTPRVGRDSGKGST